jgi:hypothetical protein
MKVRCRLCENQKDGYCTKKVNNGHHVKIELNKPRSCDLYSEDGMRVVMDYRKKEAHNANLKNVKARNAAIMKAIENARAALASRKEGLTVVEPTKEASDDQV